MKNLLMLVFAALVLVGCAKEEGPMEKMGKKMDDAAEEVGKSAEEAADAVKEAVED